MTTKHLTGAYPAGYALNAKYTGGLIIDPSATVGGSGVSVSFNTTIINHGSVDAINGASEGVILYAGGMVTNGSGADTTALIEGDGAGVEASSASARIANYGTIQGAHGVGVVLQAGGTVTNGSTADTKALISGYAVGVSASGASATIANFGTIQVALDECVDLQAGGSVTNGSAADATALIEGNLGVYAYGASVTIANFGTIRGREGYGIELTGGGTVTNGSATDTAALIEGDSGGVYVAGASATVTNYGTIQGQGGDGVALTGGGSVANGSAKDATALIEGFYGVGVGGETSGVATVMNFGTIDGTGGAAVLLNGAGDVLLAEAGSTILGVVDCVQGSVDVVSGAASFTGGLTTGGTVKGAGTLALTGGTTTFNAGASLSVATMSISGGAAVGVNASITDSGALTQASGTTIALGANTLTLTGTGSSVAGSITGTGTLVFGGGTQSLATGASLGVSKLTLSGGTVTTLSTSLGYGGDLTQGAGTTLALKANTLTLTGSASTLAGSVTGIGGTLAIAGGRVAINTGASLSVSTLALTGGTTTLGESLTYAGAFNEGAGATLTLTTADKYTLSGATTLSGTVNGASTLKVSNATVNGLTIGGTAELDDTGSVIQTGAITVGDKTSSVATLTIAAGATYTIESGGVAIGKAKTSSIKNSGTLTYSGTGESVIAVKTDDTGSIIAASGVLDFAGALTGTGSMTVDSGATLEVDKTAASTLSMTFNGGGATLALKDVKKFAPTINGFAATDIIDILKKKATTATLGAGDTLVIKNGTTAVATLQLAGTYTGDTFNVASDGNGGTNITVTTGGAANPPAALHPFIAAMAGLGVGEGAAIGMTRELHPSTFRSVISAPGMVHLA